MPAWMRPQLAGHRHDGVGTVGHRREHVGAVDPVEYLARPTLDLHRLVHPRHGDSRPSGRLRRRDAAGERLGAVGAAQQSEHPAVAPVEDLGLATLGDPLVALQLTHPASQSPAAMCCDGAMSGTVVVAIAPDQRAELEQALTPSPVEFRSVGPDRVVAEAPVDDPATVSRSLRDAGFTATVGPRSEGARLAWARHLEPVWFGEGRCVCLPWADLDRSAAELVVEIDPGAGFGAGRHPSTAMLLEFLDRRVVPGATVLDVGCGSGVLAVVSARLGASRVRAVDVDPAAVAATVANAEQNGVADRIEVDDPTAGRGRRRPRPGRGQHPRPRPGRAGGRPSPCPGRRRPPRAQRPVPRPGIGTGAGDQAAPRARSDPARRLGRAGRGPGRVRARQAPVTRLVPWPPMNRLFAPSPTRAPAPDRSRRSFLAGSGRLGLAVALGGAASMAAACGSGGSRLDRSAPQLPRPVRRRSTGLDRLSRRLRGRPHPRDRCPRRPERRV